MQEDDSSQQIPVDNPDLNNLQKNPKDKKGLLVSCGVVVLIIAGAIISWGYIQNSNTSDTVNSPNTPKSNASSVAQNNHNQKPNIPSAINPINPAAIPLGTGHVSTSPELGYVDFCSYKPGSIAAEPSLPWINAANNTWNSETKPAVAGSVSWSSQAYFTNTISGTSRTITTNDLPINHDTGVFPISLSDPAYQYDHNPNHIAPQPTTWHLPANPTAAPSPNCTRDGPIGILNDGVFLFNALDAQNRDAGATEILDQWQGHPQSSGIYHHHTVPNFMLAAYSAKSSSTLVGYALDGYGIYIERDANGNLLTNSNLDSCHGRTSWVMWNGKMTYMYHYDVTLEYPYTVGCYHGTPLNLKLGGSGKAANQPRPPAARP